VQWTYLSPHPDDVALSCGGLLWEQVHSGEKVNLWTICAADPPAGPLSPFAEALQTRWEVFSEASAVRRAEDLRSCALLGASARHFPIADCIYRRSAETGAALYDSEEAIFGPVCSDEAFLVTQLARQISQAFKNGGNVVCPLALGGHVDHRLARAAAEMVGQPLWYYADYPYVLKEAFLSGFLPHPSCQPKLFSVSEAGVAAWIDSVAAHASQISTFWPDRAAMSSAIEKYCIDQGGVRLWSI
jgi:LmbE family N-acetylglucosaminyl deacetylase